MLHVYKLYGWEGGLSSVEHFQKLSNVNVNTRQKSPHHPFMRSSQFSIKVGDYIIYNAYACLSTVHPSECIH